jgi:hypothetical protein
MAVLLAMAVRTEVGCSSLQSAARMSVQLFGLGLSGVGTCWEAVGVLPTLLLQVATACNTAAVNYC